MKKDISVENTINNALFLLQKKTFFHFLFVFGKFITFRNKKCVPLSEINQNKVNI